MKNAIISMLIASLVAGIVSGIIGGYFFKKKFKNQKSVFCITDFNLNKEQFGTYKLIKLNVNNTELYILEPIKSENENKK